MTPQVHDTPGVQTLGHGSSKSYDSQRCERCAKLDKTLRLLLKARQASHMKAQIREALK